MNLRGGPNIVQLLEVVRDPSSKTPALITEFVNAVDFRELYPKLKPIDFRFYLYELLKASGFLLILITSCKKFFLLGFELFTQPWHHAQRCQAAQCHD